MGGCSGGLVRWEGVQGGCSGGGVQVGGLFRWRDCSGGGCSGRGGGRRVFSETKIKWKKNPFLCDFFFVIKSIIMDSKRIIMHFVLATKMDLNPFLVQLCCMNLTTESIIFTTF